jgi:phenylacetate-CoA ligase
VARLLSVFGRRRISGEIVLVNDASTDATAQVIDALARQHREIVAVHHPSNRGLAAGWQTGLEAATGVYVCFIDADLQNPPEEVWRLYREITLSRADMVQGVRSSIGRLKDGRYALSRVLNVMLNVTFGMSAVDNKSGFVMARRETMRDILRHRFQYRHAHVFVAAAAKAKGFTQREVETLFQSRHAGTSFIKNWPVKLVTEVCVDTAKAFVELRLLRQPIDELEQFLRTMPSDQPPRPAGLWRQLITRRVRPIQDALTRTQWASPDRIRGLQDLRLRRLIRHAYQHVPYYRELFDALGIRPEEIVTVSDLQRLPVLSKDDVREHLYFDLFADNHRKREMQKVTTSTDDGAPLELYVDRTQLEMRLAAALRAKTWTEAPREYGHPECRGVGYECQAGDGHHVTAESYIVEVLCGARPANPGEVGDVVITDLDGFSVPLIRYRIGDRAIAAADPCACGRGLLRIRPVEQANRVDRGQPTRRGRPAGESDGTLVGLRT